MGVKKVGSKSKLKKVSTANLSLPENPSEVSENLEDYTWLIYGDRKIGKTTLLSQFDDAFFLMFDPPNRGLNIYQRYCETWRDFLGYIKLLEENPNYCKMLIIDTGFMAYERCFQHKCKELGITDPRDKAWGNAWKAISREFMEAHDRIFKIGVGFAVTAHSEVKQITRRDGSEYNKMSTQLGAQALKYYNGIVDVIAYYQYNKKGNRELTIAGDSFVEAGSRIQGHFKYTNGETVKHIPMGDNQEKAFENLKLAFNNKLVKKEKKEGSKRNRTFKRKKK